MSRRTHRTVYDFRGAQAPPVAASSDSGPFVKAVTAAAGTPTVKTTTGNGLTLQFTSTSQVENLCVYMGDVLPYDIDDLVRIEIIAKTTATLDATTSAAIGLASARNDTLDSVAEHAWFRLEGDNNLLAESDDGTTDIDDKATGQTLVASWKRLVLDFTNTHSQAPPSSSLPGKANVHFLCGNANGSLRRVCRNTRFDLNQYAGGLQLLFQLQKTADTNQDALHILRAEVEARLSV